MNGARTAQRTRLLAKRIAAQFAGKVRGQDAKIHRNSYDADEDPRARPWRPIGRGTVGEGLAHREALLETAEEKRVEEWKLIPHAMRRAARANRDCLSAELASYENKEAPIGRLATLRIEIAKIEVLLERARLAIRRIDITILGALIRRVDFASGMLFPAIDTIAADAGCHRNSVIGALRRLRHHGFIAWVRRSIKTDKVGEFGPQREQTSNAYYFDHRAGMDARTWQRFVQRLTVRVKRLAKALPQLVARDERRTPADDPYGLHAAIAALGDAVTTSANAST